MKSKADVTEKRESRGMKRKILMKRLLAVTLATSLVISGTPISVSAADETSEQIVQDTAENVEQPTEGATDENAGDNSIQETEETQSTNESQQNVEIPETETQQEIQTPEAGNTVENAESAEHVITLKVNEQGEVLTTEEEVKAQLTEMFQEDLAGTVVKDWNIYSTAGILRRWVPISGESYGLVDYPGILQQKEGTYQIGVNRYFSRLDFTKLSPKVEKEFTITLKQEVAYATRDLNLTITGNGTVKAGSKELVSGTNAVSKNEVVLSFVPGKNQYVKTVTSGETDLTSQMTFDQCTGTYTLAAGEDAQALRVEFAEAGLKAKAEIGEVPLTKTTDDAIDYDAVKADIIKNVIDTETSVPADTQTLSVQYSSSYVDAIPIWKDLNYQPTAIEKAFGLGSQKIKLSYAGNERYPASDLTANINVVEAGEETTLILQEGCTVTFAPEEQMNQELFEKVAPKVYTADGEEVETTRDDFDLTYEKTTGDVAVTFKYKGKVNEYKASEATVTVKILKGAVKVSVQNQNITYGEAFTEPVVTTTPEGVDYVAIIGGINGDAQGFVSIKMPESIKNLGSIDIPLVGTINIYNEIVKLFGDGVDLNQLPSIIDEINKMLGWIENIPGAPNLGIDFDTIQKILDYLPDNINAKVYLEKDPFEAGLYVVGAVTTDQNYNTGAGVGFLTIAPKTADVKLVFNQELPKGNIIPVKEADSFTFGGKLVDTNDEELEGNICTLYAGTSFDGEFHTNTEPIKEPGVYTETVYLLGGNYFALPIIRTYTIARESTTIQFDDDFEFVTYDGNAHSLSAGVYDSEGNRIADAVLTYSGLEFDGTVYYSKEAPVNAGTYQVTATYWGDATYQPSLPNIAASVTITKAEAATVTIDDVTTEYGSTEPVSYTYTTNGIVEKDQKTILKEIKCEEGADLTKDHKIVGTVNKSVAKNYKKVTVEPGTHYVKQKKTVHVTLLTNTTSGAFPDGVDVLNYDLTEGETELTLPEVTPNDGWEFTGWYVAGKEPQTIAKDAASIDVMDYADFTNDADHGTLTIFATYEKKAPKTVYASIVTDKEKGVFESGENLENHTLKEDAPELQLPSVQANAGYEFAGWLVSGKDGDVSIDKETMSINVMDYAFFAEGSEEGYVSVTAVYEEVETPEPEERTVNVTFNVAPEQGRFTDPEGAEVVTYENIPEFSDQQFLVPKVEANEGYEFTGWLVNGAEEGHWDANAETFGITGLAHFPEGSNVGYVTITAQFEKVETPEPEERTVNVTFNVNPEQGRFTDPEGAEIVTYENIPEFSDQQFLVPKVEANEGYEFTGWLVNGAEEGHWDANAETFGITGLAHFPEGSNVGYVTITAQFEKVETPEPEERTVNVTFNVNPEQGRFTDPEGAEIVTYENIPEFSDQQFLVPKVEANEGYEFTGWLVNGAEEGHWDANAETFGITGLAHFPEGSNVGYITVTALFKETIPVDPENPDTPDPENPDPENPDTPDPENPDSETPEKPDSGEQNNQTADKNTNSKQDTNKKAVQTGDMTPIVGVGIVLAAALAVIAAVLFKKRKDI